MARNVEIVLSVNFRYLGHLYFVYLGGTSSRSEWAFEGKRDIELDE